MYADHNRCIVSNEQTTFNATFSYLRSKAQIGVYNLCTTVCCGTRLINHLCGLTNMEQIFTPFQVNKNKIIPSTTLECSYLSLLLHSICGFTM